MSPSCRCCDQLALVDLEVHGAEPGAQQCERVLGADVVLRFARAHVALVHDPLDDLQDRRRVRTAVGLAVAERADRERHRRMRPLRGAALIAVRDGVAGADVREELRGVERQRRLGEGAADVDAGVVIGAADSRCRRASRCRRKPAGSAPWRGSRCASPRSGRAAPGAGGGAGSAAPPPRRTGAPARP